MPLIHRPFRRVGIVNRGEAAVRFLRAARAWARKRREPLEVVALYTTPDRDAVFVREADDAVFLGDALVSGPEGLRSAYLDIARVVRLLSAAGCDAVWPGWGFVSERPDFADACAAAGLVFIGPSGESMRLLGDKIAGKRLAETHGVPVTAWSGGPVADVDEAVRHADRIGYPVLLKAAAGGGGRGIRIVRAAGELAGAFASAAHEARAAFGDATLLVEAFAPEARHVEVQVIADVHGRVHAVGTRDCSMQRRHQKVLEEAPAPGLGALDARLREAAVSVARASGYVNAGTAEFLVLPDRSAFFFLEMNTRLQVEHPVTEAVTGLDMVGLQIDVARGEPLPDALPVTRGHAIEARLNAEDADADFRPSAGKLLRFELATGPGVRVDAGFVAGDVVPGEFDSMLAKIIAAGPTREEALSRLEEALDRTTVAIEGGASNRSLLLELITHDAFRRGPVTTRWLDRHLTQRGGPLERRHLDGALIAAAIGEYARARAEDVSDLLRHAHRGLPSNVPPPEPRGFRFSVGSESVALEVTAIAPNRYRVSCGEALVEVGYTQTGPCTATLTLRGRRYPVTHVTTPTALHVEVDSVAHRLERAADGRVVAPVPAAVTHVNVREGDSVSVGDRLMTLEVMKMEVAITAPIAGRISRLLVEVASRVSAGHALAIIEAGAAEAEAQAAEALPAQPTFVLLGDAPEATTGGADTTLLAATLGYDPPAAAIDAALGQVAQRRVPVGRRLLTRLLDAFISHERLFEPAAGLDATAQVDLLARHLRFQSEADADLPAAFKTRLQAALAWHDVTGLAHTPRHDDALLRILQAHGALGLRSEILMAVLTAALEEDVPESTAAERDGFRDRLEAFAALVVRRDRVLAEAAYAALYHLCDRPRQVDEARRLAMAAREAVSALVSPDCAAEERTRLEAALEALPKGALLSVVRDSASLSEPAVRGLLLDLLTRRLHLGAVKRASLPGGSAAMYAVGTVRLATVLTTPSALLDDARAALAQEPPDAPATDMDVFLSEPSTAWLTAFETEGALALAELPACVRRFSINWGSVELGRLSRTLLRGVDGRFIEDRFLRDFHPARVEWRELSRMGEFDLERVPAPGEIFLAVARAKADPSDERLMGIVEVERFDPERDLQTGKLLRVPSFERVYMTTLHAMRQAHRVLKQSPKPFWNRLIVYVRPTLTVTMDEIRHTTRRLAPATSGLGIEVMILRGYMPDPAAPGGRRALEIDWTNPTNHGATLSVGDHDYTPVTPVRADERRVIEARRKGLFYPYELVRALSRETDDVFPRGRFQELELSPDGESLVPADRPHGQNTAHVVVGVVSNTFGAFDEGLRRVLLLGDPTRGMGSLAEPECRRIIAAFDLAEREGLSVEWVAVSSGARIAMDSGTENLDWTARVLARIVRFTQGGGTVNVIVDGINVGAQSYWNAEATMLQHCRGALIMTPQGAMLLTGKKALEYAGSVSAEDNNAIGGFGRIMGPNGEAQYFAADLTAAYQLLFRHLALTAVAPGEDRPRRLPSRDPIDRDVTTSAYPVEDAAEGYTTVGDIFDEVQNPGRKRPFGIRPVMRAVLDADVPSLERWAAWQGAESAVVWEGALGGDPVCCVGIESRPVPRRGEAPADGPDHWTSGTLFPQSSKKVARAINAASGVRPVVVLANLSGFDGSPESLRHLQLEYGAEIGRAVVNFRGPIVFCVVARYHGGAYVVFSRALTPGLHAIALEGAYASVIGGGPASAVVFPGLVRKRAMADAAVVAARKALESAKVNARASATAEYERVLKEALGRHQAGVAREFDAIHSVERARTVGSLDTVISPVTLRPYLIQRIRGA
jgi:acetyl/propionyl-CoA carboxylase alpha subunit/acetyl-CoA carboxylase carboxyltransferase component